MPRRTRSTSRLVRALPTLVVASLLLLVWRAQMPLLADGRDPELCGEGFIQQADVVATQPFPEPVASVVQPLTVTATMGSIAWHVTADQNVFYSASIRALDPHNASSTWDLVSLGDQSVSPGESRWLSGDPDRPIVLGRVANTFTNVTSTHSLMIDMFGEVNSTVDFDPEGPAELEPAYWLAGGVETPLQGPHPVLAHTVCADPETGTGLKVLQEVLAVTGLGVASSTIIFERAQAFTVPTDGHVEWVELAVPELPPPSPPAARTIEIRDAQGMPLPPAGPLTATSTITFLTPDPAVRGDVWRPSQRFAEPVRLEAGHLYWLIVRDDDASQPLGVYLDGIAGHPLSARASDADDFVEQPGALSFRLIGRPDPLIPPLGECPVPGAIGGVATSTLRLDLGQRAALSWSTVTSTPALPILSARLPYAQANGGFIGASSTMRLGIADPATGLPRTDTFPLAVGRGTTSSTSIPIWGVNIADRKIVTTEVPGVAQSAGAGDGLGGALYVEARNPNSVPLHVGTGNWHHHDIPCDMFVDLADGIGWRGATSTLALDVCPSNDPGDAKLRVLQQVVRATSVCCPSSTPPPFELVQTITVPEAGRVDQVELALPAQAGSPLPLALSLQDAGGLAIPGPGPLEATSTWGLLDPTTTDLSEDRWVGVPLFEPITVEPGTLYWLHIRLEGEWLVGSDVAEGLPRGPGANPWPEGIFSFRASEQESFAEDPDRDLSFRLIGEAFSVVGVPGTVSVTPPRLRLRAAPMPFRSGVAIMWSALGVEGVRSARVEIIDASGRLVRHAPEVRFAGEGRWVWDARDDAGRDIASGVYFARVSTGSETRAVKIVRLP